MWSIDVGEDGEARHADLGGPSASSSDAAGVHASLVAMLARDLRAPIATVIMGLSEVTEVSLERDPNTARLLQLIRCHAERALAAAEDVADLGAIECGTLRCDRAPLDLTDTVKCGVQRVLLESAASGVTVSLDSALGPIRLIGDRPRLERVIAGLVADAARRAHSSVRVRFKLKRVEAQLEIIDDGPDSDVCAVEALLDARHATPAPDLPWGLAARLAITRDIIAAHDGTISVARANRRRQTQLGARVSVQLPVQNTHSDDELNRL